MIRVQHGMLQVLGEFMGQTGRAIGDLKAVVTELSKEAASLRTTVAEGHQLRDLMLKAQATTLREKRKSVRRLRQGADGRR